MTYFFRQVGQCFGNYLSPKKTYKFPYERSFAAGAWQQVDCMSDYWRGFCDCIRRERQPPTRHPFLELIFEQGDVIYVSRSWWEICERLYERKRRLSGHWIDSGVVLLQPVVCLGRSKTISDLCDVYSTHTYILTYLPTLCCYLLVSSVGWYWSQWWTCGMTYNLFEENISIYT